MAEKMTLSNVIIYKDDERPLRRKVKHLRRKAKRVDNREWRNNADAAVREYLRAH